jgi:hypothetical protein
MHITHAISKICNRHIHVRLKVQLDAHGFICILYSSVFALHVLGAICTYHQEHNLQSTAIGMRNLWKAEVISSIKQCRVTTFICMNLWVCVYWLIKVMVALHDIYVLVCKCTCFSTVWS